MQGLELAAVLARTQEAAVGADTGKWLQMLAAGLIPAAGPEMPLAGLRVEEEPSPPAVGGGSKRVGVDQLQILKLVSICRAAATLEQQSCLLSNPVPKASVHIPAPCKTCSRQHHVATRCVILPKIFCEFCIEPYNHCFSSRPH